MTYGIYGIHRVENGLEMKRGMNPFIKFTAWQHPWMEFNGKNLEKI